MPLEHRFTVKQNSYASTRCRVPCAKLVFLMGWIRPRLACVAAGWLVFRVALLVWVPATLCTNVAATAAAECTCDHGDGQMCPMHHVRAKAHGATSSALSPGSPASPSCSCRSTADPLGAMAATPIGSPAVLAVATVSVISLEPTATVHAIASEPLHWASVPDSPPPRS